MRKGLLGKEKPLTMPADISDLFQHFLETAHAWLTVEVGLSGLIYCKDYFKELFCGRESFTVLQSSR